MSTIPNRDDMSIKNNQILKELEYIESEICTIESLVTVVRDSCVKNNYITQELVLNIAQKRLIDIANKISLIDLIE